MHNLAQMFIESEKRWGSRCFVCSVENDKLQSLSYRTVAGQVQDWALFLRNRGVKGGDRVAFVTPKSPNQIRAFYACWWLGAIAVPICESLGDKEMSFIIADAEPALILVDASSKAKVLANARQAPVILFDEIRCNTPPAALDVAETSGDALAALIYTSGSTGMPKGVMLTHRNFLVNAETALEHIRLTEEDVILSLLPYWHSFGLVVEVIVAAMGGLQVAIPRDKRDFKKNVLLYRPTIILLVPRIADVLREGILKRIEESAPRVQALFNLAMHNASRIFTAGPRLDGGLLRMLTHLVFYDPFVFRRVRHAFGGRLKFFISGGAPLDLEHQIFFKYMGVPIYQGYGLTETTPIVSTNCEGAHKLGSCGRVLPWLRPERGGDYTFLDEGGRRGPRRHGELLLRGACVTTGYWRRHQDTSSKILRDGWLHTGDIGHMDAEGFLYVDGRKSNMLVLAGGEKLHPEHVEDAIKSCDLISEAMVVGDKCKNVYACVSLYAEAAAKIPADQLQATVRRKVQDATAHLAPFQRPRDVLILPGFSVEDGTITVSLKIRRHIICERYGEQIRAFLCANGEETSTKAAIGIASSKILESLNHPAHDSNR